MDRAVGQDAKGSERTARVLGVASLACFGLALLIALAVVARSIDDYRQGAGPDVAAAGRAAMMMALLHLVGMVGTALGFAGRHAPLARWGLWLNTILLVVYWLGVALWPL